MNELGEFLKTPFEKIDRSLLLRKYEEVFGKKLDPKCVYCYRRAYIELTNHNSVNNNNNPMGKNTTETDKDTPKTGKYSFAPGHEGSQIHIKAKGWSLDDATGISDEQGDYIVANIPEMVGLLSIAK